MSRLNDLLRRLETVDRALGQDLKREVDALTDRRAFGLNFERHAPEAVELPKYLPQLFHLILIDIGTSQE